MSGRNKRGRDADDSHYAPGQASKQPTNAVVPSKLEQAEDTVRRSTRLMAKERLRTKGKEMEREGYARKVASGTTTLAERERYASAHPGESCVCDGPQSMHSRCPRCLLEALDIIDTANPGHGEALMRDTLETMKAEGNLGDETVDEMMAAFGKLSTDDRGSGAAKKSKGGRRSRGRAHRRSGHKRTAHKKKRHGKKTKRSKHKRRTRRR